MNKYQLSKSMSRKSRHGKKVERRDSHRIIKQEARRARGECGRPGIKGFLFLRAHTFGAGPLAGFTPSNGMDSAFGTGYERINGTLTCKEALSLWTDSIPPGWVSGRAFF